MSPLTIVFASVRYYWRTHLGVILGTALAAMVLIGSLLVGDSVKATLRKQALDRVGQVESALLGGDRYFRSDLANEVGDETAPVLFLRGTLAKTDGSARINSAQILGVDERFWKLAPESAPTLTGESIALNQRAASQLGLEAGGTVVLRLEKPGVFSRDAPLSGEENEVIAIRATVARIVPDAEFGRFSLAAGQIPPSNVYVPLGFLQQRLSFEGKANLLLSRDGTETLKTNVTAKWRLEDASMELRQLPENRGYELRSSRVFLDEPMVKAAPRGLDSLTYLVNELRAGDKATPYSMVTAVDAPSSGFLPAELNDDEIVITQWLADDLGVKLNDRISLKYFVMGERRQLIEESREFEIIEILPMTDPVLNTSWMPDFPGLSDQANCRDWKPGFAIDNSRIRDKDEAYWDQYRGTPKAFVNLPMGQKMWGNRWGKVTSIRYPAKSLEFALSSEIRAKLTLEQLGFSFTPLRSVALAATDAPVDFGQLFVSFSFFLIVAAAVLTGLLFVFTLEQRSTEAGTLLALGLGPKRVRRMLLGEGTVLAVIGAVLGAGAALLYTRAVLKVLGTTWRGAVGTSEFVFSASPASIVGGVLGSVIVAVLAMWWASRKQLKHSAGELLSGETREQSTSGKRRRPFVGASLIVVAVIIAIAGGGAPGAFFGAGALLLMGGVALVRASLLGLQSTESALVSSSALARRNTARRIGRSLATVAVLASGVFMVVAVDSFRKTGGEADLRRDSGTGGFALVAESASAIYEDLNSPAGRETYGLDDEAMKGVGVVPLRVREGDDASCLNLNRAVQPRLLAVKPSELASRGAFSFSGKAAGWQLLEEPAESGVVPGVVDANTLQWSMQKKLGDVVEYRDERGQPCSVRIVAAIQGSMLQGNVIIAEQHFVERFPSSGGYRFFLIDAAAEQKAQVADELSRALQDRGLEITPADRRLAEYQAVENTYLSIFQALGGLGLLLGTAGLAIVVARNVLERRREFGLLEAVGFRHRQLRSLVFQEHRWLIVFGLVVGSASALLGVWPQVSDRAGGFPWLQVLVLLGLLALGCTFWVWLATRVALRGSQLHALRTE